MRTLTTRMIQSKVVQGTGWSSSSMISSSSFPALGFWGWARPKRLRRPWRKIQEEDSKIQTFTDLRLSVKRSGSRSIFLNTEFFAGIWILFKTVNNSLVKNYILERIWIGYSIHFIRILQMIGKTFAKLTIFGLDKNAKFKPNIFDSKTIF